MKKNKPVQGLPETLIIAGLARSGKDTAAYLICEKFGYVKFNLSDVLAEELERRGEQVTKEAMAGLGDELRAKEGMGIVARMLAAKIPAGGKVVITGARSPEEVAYIKSVRTGAKVVEIYAEGEKRFARRSNADPAERGKFFARDSADEKNKGLKTVLAGADIRIANNSSMSELRKKIMGINLA
ncbi:MAG: AAA family ATPase [Candidatus Diapherotrites archaeon]